MPEEQRSDEYDVALTDPARLTVAQISACIAIISAGGAVDTASANAELPRSAALAIAWKSGHIVGVGAIKRVRRAYTSGIAKRSRESLPADTPELGYVAVHPDHRRRGLSGRLIAALLQAHHGRVFATTYTEVMKKTLAAAGFVRKGWEWKSVKGEMLSLWVKE
jgi:GNAT superfamily N-acetyltransferase